jgi:hypothetical protein
MRSLPALAVFLVAGLAAADDLVTKTRIKVQLFAAPAFVSEVSVDAYHMQCLSLDNNLYVGHFMEEIRYGEKWEGVLTAYVQQDRWPCTISTSWRTRCRDGVATR